MKLSAWILVPVMALIALAIGYGVGSALGSDDEPDAPAATQTPGTTTPGAPTGGQAPAGDQPPTEEQAPVGDQSPGAPGTPTPTAAPIEYAFPVQPAFAATYGRDHHDYPATDIFADCGTEVVAPVDGIIDEVTRVDSWNARIDDPATRGGLSVAIVGVDGVRHYGSHLESIVTAMVPGTAVQVGQVIGTVGQSGNAAETPCHLHYGLSPPRGPGDWEVRRGTVHPWPYLDAWGEGITTVSPAAAVQSWAAMNP